MKLPSFIRGLVGRVLQPAMVKVTPTDTQKFVAVLMTLPIASDVRDNILFIAGNSLSGQQKFDIVLSKALPSLVALIGDKGLDVPQGEVGDIAREFVQAVYNRVASPRAAMLARVLLTLFGVE